MKIKPHKKSERREFSKQGRLENGTYRRCPNCHQQIETGGHFAPPSMGEKGFFICEQVILLSTAPTP